MAQKKFTILVGFWQTTGGILLKRTLFNAAATFLLVLYNELTAGAIDWHAVKYAAATQLVYILLTYVRDVQDPKIPNSTDPNKG